MMSESTCATCKHWEVDVVYSNDGACRKVCHQLVWGMGEGGTGASVFFNERFGCIHHEKKESK